jgi:hypothetical protein
MVGDLGSTTKGSAKCGNGRAKLRLSDDDVGTAALIFLCTQKLTIMVRVRRLRKFDGGLSKGATGQDSGSHDTIDMFLDQSGFAPCY